MKKLLTLIFIAGFSTAAVFGQQTSSALSPLLNLYYDIKNDLVKADAAGASAKATDFLKAITAIDVKTLTEAENSAFSPLKEKLAFDARHISEKKEINHQRDHFKTFSDNFYLLAKETKLSAEPVYRQYCPMKKSYWLSNEAAIKNPYYGNQMLTCGKVTDTLKP
ncbi:MAG: DUF3347 domain-containing protein [Bacteroidota bacterium]